MCCGSAQAVGCNPVRELTVKRNAYYIIIGVNALRTITLVNRTVGVAYLSVSLGYKPLCAVVRIRIGGDKCCCRGITLFYIIDATIYIVIIIILDVTQVVNPKEERLAFANRSLLLFTF